MCKALLSTFSFLAVALSAYAAILTDGSSSLATRATTVGSVSFTARWPGPVRVVSEVVSVNTRPHGLLFVIR